VASSHTLLAHKRFLAGCPLTSVLKPVFKKPNQAALPLNPTGDRPLLLPPLNHSTPISIALYTRTHSPARRMQRGAIVFTLLFSQAQAAPQRFSSEGVECSGREAGGLNSPPYKCLSYSVLCAVYFGASAPSHSPP